MDCVKESPTDEAYLWKSQGSKPHLLQSQHEGDNCPSRQKCQTCLWDTCDQESLTRKSKRWPFLLNDRKRAKKNADYVWCSCTIKQDQWATAAYTASKAHPVFPLPFCSSWWPFVNFSILRMGFTDGGRVSEQQGLKSEFPYYRSSQQRLWKITPYFSNHAVLLISAQKLPYIPRVLCRGDVCPDRQQRYCAMMPKTSILVSGAG